MRALLVALVSAALLAAPAAAIAAPELSVTDGKYQLKDRRYVAAGDRAWVSGFEDGRFYAQGWHITGEMGGVWSQPIKLVDGVWFGIGGSWLAPARQFTSGWGYVRTDYPDTAGLHVSRTDFAPDGQRAVLFGLKLDNPGGRRTVTVQVDTHSELMSQYPWAWTTPNAGQFNLPDTGAFDRGAGALVFREDGKPDPNADTHHWAALVASNARPSAFQLGPNHRGPEDPAAICDGDAQKFCDDSSFGKGTGGQLSYSVQLPAGGSRTLWVAVAGSDQGLGQARGELRSALDQPDRALARKVATRERWSSLTSLSLPGDPQLAQAVDWGKQNLLDLTHTAENLQIRDVKQGAAYPPPLGTVRRATWVGAGFPDYPWIFATDAEYTSFANVSVGQFESIEQHAIALQQVSDLINDRSGKVTHEVASDGSNYFGTNADPGNTDETAKFPSMVALIWRWTGDNSFRDRLYDFAKRNLQYIYRELDQDGDGWPEGLGNVERPGMGPEKLDNAVYTLRGLFDLADMAQSKGDQATYAWARSKANDLLSRFEGAWWMPQFRQYADSLAEPGDQKMLQKHWIGQTPMESELTIDAQATPGLALFDNGNAALAERENACYSGTPPYNQGLFHTACGGGPDGQGEKTIFSLNSAIQAVGEGNYGRLGADQQRRYTDANVQPMLAEPWTGGTPDEQPGAMPEILPSPDFDPAGPNDANVDRCTRCRAMFMQAWGNYGTMWPVVHQQLGVRPDMGRRVLTVVPQLPPGDPAGGRTGRNIRLGDGALALVRASQAGNRYTTEVDTGTVRRLRDLYIGYTLPRGAQPTSVLLDGRPVSNPAQRLTNRGNEVTVKTTPGHHVLDVVSG